MAAEGAGQGLVTFEDVALYFSREEWAMLTAGQRDLYQEVMEDNFELVASLGPQTHPRPELICKMERGEEPCALDLPRQGGEDPHGTRLSAAQLPKVQDLAIKEEPSGGGPWTPLAPPESRAPGAGFGPLPSWRKSKPPEVGKALPSPQVWEEGGGRAPPEEVEWQICTCGRSFEDEASLRKHQALHAEEEEEEKGPWVCTACGKLFQYRLNLLTHKKHRGRKRHSCAQCGLRFCLKGDLLRHRAGHAADGLHPCRVCGLLFRRKRHLLAHEAEHGRDTAFGHEARLGAHRPSRVGEEEEEKEEKEEERPFLCATCGKSFSWKESLQVHQRTHGQGRGHACSACGKTFSRHGNLLTHQRLHTGELPFSCPQCDRHFPSRASLVLHSRSHRPGRPSFPSRDSSLREHQEAHGTGEGPVKQEVEP